MTRDELIQLLDDALSELDEVEMHVFGQLEQEVGNAIESIRAAKSGIEQLGSLPAMTWQAPSCECMAYVQECGDYLLLGNAWQ